MRVLQLRECLKGSARDLGRGETCGAIFAALRLRYGITPKEARRQLLGLRKNSQITLQEHSSQVERLADVAHRDLPEEAKLQMTLEAFTSTLAHLGLQRHLLLAETPTLEAAVRAGNEYLQLCVHQPARTATIWEAKTPAPHATQI